MTTEQKIRFKVLGREKCFTKKMLNNPSIISQVKDMLRNQLELIKAEQRELLK